MRDEGSDAIPGYMTQLTVTGPFVNKTLFDQAGVELPGADATGRTGPPPPARSPRRPARLTRWRWTAPATGSPAPPSARAPNLR